MNKAHREIPAQLIRKRAFMLIKIVILLHLCLACLVRAEPLTLPAERHVKAVTLASPEREHDIELNFKEQAGVVTFAVPEVSIYEIAVVTMK